MAQQENTLTSYCTEYYETAEVVFQHTDVCGFVKLHSPRPFFHNFYTFEALVAKKHAIEKQEPLCIRQSIGNKIQSAQRLSTARQQSTTANHGYRSSCSQNSTTKTHGRTEQAMLGSIEYLRFVTHVAKEEAGLGVSS